MARTLFIAAMVIALGTGRAYAQAPSCEVSDNATSQQKSSCMQAASMMVDQQPTLSAAQVTNGPGFDPADPTKNAFQYFTPDSTLNCYFRPHYAFAKVPGDSLKFQCWHMTPDGGFYTKKGDVVRADDVKVVITKDKDGEKDVALYPKSDTNNEHEIKAEHLKVKYLKPPFPNHNPRFNEVFTSVASARFMWVLGFPADHDYPAGTAKCIGCGDDPFHNKVADNKASLKDAPVVFSVVGVERDLPWDEIDTGGDSTWSWNDATKLYANGWSHQQKVQYDAYRLALGLIHYHNALPQQNRLSCAEWADGGSAGTRTCKTAVLYVHDLGSTFGKKRSGLDLFGTNPRGSFSAWQPQTVFTKADNCELRATLLGPDQVLKEAQDLMVQRVARLDRETVKAIFRDARFNMVDQDQVRRLKSKGSQNVDEDALNEWTDTFMQRVEEIRSAKNCKAN